ncbi:MAG: exopolysaccharide biosynthesis polyprenyl glycosylphosphotransferase, partial [Asticcacaulis sp.]
ERRDINSLGIFDDRLARSPDAVVGVPVLGDTEALLSHKITPFVDKVVVALDPSARTRMNQILDRLRALPNEVALLVDLETESSRATALTRVSDLSLASVHGQTGDQARAFSKRLLDLGVGSLALLLFSPVMLLVALLIKLDSPGPVFFRQRRHGFNNEEIHVWKFRSMRTEMADAKAERQVTQNDDRVTRIGRFIRKTSLDELPQLFNVLKGEMSLVGPRPHAIGMKTGPSESARLVAEYAWRHRIKPGMTGWAAVKGSRGPLHTADDVRRRIKLDIEYIDRQSIWFDLYIMAITVPCLLGDRDAIR